MNFLEMEKISKSFGAINALQGVDFFIKPHTRFKGKPGEQATFFIKDPSGNALEFKSFKDKEMIFKNF